jgi:hypothetical protein
MSMRKEWRPEKGKKDQKPKGIQIPLIWYAFIIDVLGRNNFFLKSI